MKWASDKKKELADIGGSDTKDVPPGPPLDRTPPFGIHSCLRRLSNLYSAVGETIGGQQRSPRCHEEGNGKIEGNYPQDYLLCLQIWWRKEADTVSYDGVARQTDNESLIQRSNPLLLNERSGRVVIYTEQPS